MKQKYNIEEIIAFVLLLFCSINTAQGQVVESEKCIGGNGDDKIIDVRPTSDSGTLLIVETSSNNEDFPDNHGGRDVGLIKLNKANEIEWKQCLGSSMDDIYESIKAYGDKLLLYYRYFDTSGMVNSIYSPIIKNVRVYIRSDGTIIWDHEQTSYSEGFLGIYNDCIPTKDNGAFITSYQNDNIKTTIIARLNQDGDTLWQDKKYPQFPSSSIWSWVIKKMIYYSWELQDSSILVFENFRFEDISWSPSGEIDSISYCERRHYSKQGELLSVDTFRNYTPVKYMHGEPILETDSILYLFTYKNLISFCPAFSLAGFRKSDLSLASELEFGYGTDHPFQYYQENIRQFSFAEQSIYLIQYAYDNTNSLILNKYSFTGAQAWSTVIDSDSLSSPNTTQIIFLQKEHAVLVFYMKGNTEYFCKINKMGQILFRRPFLQVPGNYSRYMYTLQGEYQYYNLAPYHFFPCQRQADALPNNLYQISENKLYSGFIYIGTNNSVGNYQPLQVTDLNTGSSRIIYENFSDQNSYTLFKYLKPLDDGRLFTAYDLRGTHKCRLGGYDIVLSMNNLNPATGTAYQPADLPLSVYPNPNNGQFTIRMENQAIIEHIQLTDLSGKTVYIAEPRSASINLDAGQVAPGFYLLQVRSGDKLFTEKILIQH